MREIKRVEATAPGKVILFGEHAVVYGRPAIAAPVNQLRAKATIETTAEPDVQLVAPDLYLSNRLSQAKPSDPLAAAIRLVQRRFNLIELNGFTLTVISEIPIAGGLGSGAAISVAVLRALAAYLDLPEMDDREEISAMAYEIERLHHGTPSGIDNTVIAYEQPVYFRRQEPNNHIEAFTPARPLRLLIGDTGVRSATKDVVGDVRRRWMDQPDAYESLFDTCGRIAESGRHAIEDGDLAAAGRLMNDNHDVLRQMSVSSSGLDRLVMAARRAGALGAKLSGAGRGGNIIALIDEHTELAVRESLLAAGAVRVFSSDVG